MRKTSTWATLVTALAVFTLAAAAHGDASGPPEPSPPHDYDASCTLEQQQDASGLCIDCTVEHDDYEANYSSCRDMYAPDGFELVCGSEWVEIWCPGSGGDGDADGDSDGDADGDSDGDTTDGDGCSTAGRNNSSFPYQLGLVVGLVAFGFIVRRRFRS